MPNGLSHVGVYTFDTMLEEMKSRDQFDIFGKIFRESEQFDVNESLRTN